MSDHLPTSFARVLRQRRLAAGLTQEALAERSGLGIRSIQGLERSETQPRRETLQRLIDALRLAPDHTAELERAGQPAPRHHRAESSTAKPAQHRSGLDPAARHNLPVQLTSFVGREHALIDLHERLRTTHLLTLIGTGGCGKTRLALQVAACTDDEYADGVWLVELAALAEPELVEQAVATVVAVREVASQPMRATLLTALRSRHLLLVLDNCEHLVEACARLTDEILRACPNVRILATSREPLGIAGEVTWRVPSLTLAPIERTSRTEDLAACEAVRLFVDRATAALPSFELTARNAAFVAQICQRLDGIPLAIELGARRVTALPVEQIAARLNRRFDLLTGGSRTALPRQQTLVATIDWSYALLSPPERVLFDRLAVFAGGFTLEAAEAVVADEDEGASSSPRTTDGPAMTDVLDLLTHLVDKSLVVADLESAGTGRYRLLETLRQYAHERLVARGEREEIRCRHAAYYLSFALEAGQHLLGPDQVSWLDLLDRDHDNLHAALSWAIERRDAELGMRMAVGLAYFWYFRGHFSEAQALRAAVLALPARPDLDPLRAELLQGAGLLTLQLGDYVTARAFLNEGVTIARRVGDRGLLIPTLATLGFVTRVQCEYDTARSMLEEGVTLARAAGDIFHTAMALHHLGLLALEADRDLDMAWSLNEEALALFGRIGNRRMLGVVRLAMGRVARARSDLSGARALVAEALILHGQISELGIVPQMMYVLAALDADAGRLDRAVELASAAAALEETIGTRVWPVILRERDAWLEPARHALGDAAFALAWEAGQAMTREQAVAHAMVDDHPA